MPASTKTPMRSSATATLRIATRTSALAMHQAKLVAEAFRAHGIMTELATFKTVGDEIVDRPLAAVGSKGLFTEELERALRDGSVDCCVHSLKDLPTESPAGVIIGGVLRREDPRDVLISRAGIRTARIQDLPRGTRVGTSSPRRRVQLAAARPDLEILDIRGNVATRLAKVRAGVVDATILAHAGLLRLGIEPKLASLLDAPQWLPAPGQGAIAIQVRESDDTLVKLAESVTDQKTLIAVTAERAFLSAFNGGCQLPCGALAVADPIRGDAFTLYGMIQDAITGKLVRNQLDFAATDAYVAGRSLAEVIKAECASLETMPVVAGAED